MANENINETQTETLRINNLFINYRVLQIMSGMAGLTYDNS